MVLSGPEPRLTPAWTESDVEFYTILDLSLLPLVMILSIDITPLSNH